MSRLTNKYSNSKRIKLYNYFSSIKIIIILGKLDFIKKNDENRAKILINKSCCKAKYRFKIFA